MSDLEDIIRRIVREEVRAALADATSARPVAVEPGPRWLSSGDAAARSGRHLVTIRRALEEGELQGSQTRPGARWSVRPCCVDSWLSGGTCEPHVGDGLLTARQAADWLQVDVGTLANWRVARQGPPSVKIGRSVRYRLADLEMWVASESSAVRQHGRH